MKNSILKLTCAILIIMFALAIMPTAVKAAEEVEGVILEKADGEKIIYIKNMESTEFKYAFSNDNDASSATFITSSKDSNGEYVAFIEDGETYNYMFITSGDKTDTVELKTFKAITENEIKSVEKLTKIIGVKTDESNSNVAKENDTVVTTTRGKIVIEDEGDYQYQLIEIVDKNNSTKELNETAVELYNQIATIKNLSKMYDKLLAEIAIRDNYNKLIEEAKWEDAKNKEILQPEDSQEEEKFVVLIQEVKDGETVRSDIKFMTCAREDDEGVEKTETEKTKVVEKKTALPVTGENLALYIIFGIIILAIIILVVRMKKANKDEEE